MGKAIGFFDCKASKERLDAALPIIREDIGTPSALEHTLTEGVGILEGGFDLLTAYEKAKTQITYPDSLGFFGRIQKRTEIRTNTDLRYVITATLPNATNKETAQELGTILNQAFQSTLYEEREHFRGGIAYQENGRYVLKQDKK